MGGALSLHPVRAASSAHGTLHKSVLIEEYSTMAREESGIQSPDSAWKKNERAISSSPILQRSEYLLREEEEEKGGGEPRSVVVIRDCQCDAQCQAMCCRSRYDSGRPPDETTPLLGQRELQSIRCACHKKVVDKTSSKARNKLIIACILALLFMIGEAVGGYLSHSLAILTDAAHMLSDFASFLISLFAIWVSSRKPSKDMSFGWHRAEVLGAVVSVLIIWVVTGVLVYEAIQRCIYQNFEIDANVMLITASAGVVVNVFMMAVLHQHGHGHSHGHSSSGEQRRREENGHSSSGRRGREEREEREGEEGGEGRERNREGGGERRRRGKGLHNKNINVHAAFIHVVGDLIQSIGIVIAGYIIWFKPEWKLADPVCTFLFSILVLASTINILRDTLRVLMEGTPRHINYEAVKADLARVEGVKHAHSLQIWSLTLNKTALAVHLALEPGANNQTVLEEASCMLKERYSITQTTLQVENYQPTMEECHTCQDVSTPSCSLSSSSWKHYSFFRRFSRDVGPSSDSSSDSNGDGVI